MDLVVAVVEIEGTAGMIILAVFVTVFLVVAALAWWIAHNMTVSTSKSPSTWRLSTDIPLPVSRQATFDRLTDAVAKGASRPSLTPEQRHFVTGLSNTRRKLATGYRVGLVVVGVAGVALSIAIYRDYVDDEMILLPVAIIFLLSLGILLGGLIPSRTVDPIEPIDPDLLKKIQLNVTSQPLTVQLNDEVTARAMKMLSGGMTPADVARQVIPGYDHLDDRQRQEVERAIARLRRG